MATEHRILVVEVIKAANVAHVRGIGRQDNYVVVAAAGERCATKPDWGSGSEPNWGKLGERAGCAELRLPTRSSSTAAAPVLVHVMSKNRFAADAVAGTATLDLAAVAVAKNRADGRRDTLMELPLAPQGILTLCLYQVAGAPGRGGGIRGGRSSGSAPPKSWKKKGGGQTLGGDGANSATSADARRAAMLAAAERRAGGESGSVQGRAVAKQKQKEALLGKLDALYARQGTDPPFGLATMDTPQLQRLLQRMSAQ